MTDDKDKDDLDPSDWLASQFGEDPPAPATPVPPVPPAAAPPVPDPTPAAPAVPTTPPASTPPSSFGSGSFQWGLTPGSEVPAEPATPVPPVPPVVPTAPVPPTEPPLPSAPLLPDAPIIPQPTIPSYQPPTDAPTQAFPPAQPATPDEPTQAMPTYPGQDLEPAAWDPWQARPLDDSLEGATEVIEAEIIGLDGPEGESNPTPSIDDIFGDGLFKDYADEGIIPPPPAGGPKPPKPPKGERAPIPKVQKILLWVAGGLLAILALIALFLLGTRLPAAFGPAPALTPSATPTPTPSIVVLGPGPVEPGEHQWDALLGGECLSPFESAWQDRYTVVDCATPHPAQMVYRGLFTDAADVVYPGVEELQKRINLLCTAPTVINYQVAGTAQDIQVTASFAADAEDWDAGNRTYFCFVSRASGENLTASVALPQPAVTITPTP